MKRAPMERVAMAAHSLDRGPVQFPAPARGLFDRGDLLGLVDAAGAIVPCVFLTRGSILVANSCGVNP